MTRATDWTGPVGDVWSREWRRTDRSFAALAPHLDAAILAAAPAGGFAALDIGCGAGATSLALAAARADAGVTGVDLSAALVDVAAHRAAGRANVAFVAGDAPAEAKARGPFDLYVSRHGVMFFDDPAAAFADLHEAAAPDAALVFSCFDTIADNPWATVLFDLAEPAGPGPFAFADRDRVAALFAGAGWRDAAAHRVEFAYRVGEGADPVADARDFLCAIGPTASRLRAAPPDARAALLARLTTALEARRDGNFVDFPASAWLWSARA